MSDGNELDPNAVDMIGFSEAETPPADEPSPEVNDQAEPLELTDEDELVEGGEEGEEEGEKKPRSKSAKQRIDELTKARREAERERDELRAMLAGKQTPQTAPVELVEPDPNDTAKYEFGESDPLYIKDMIRFEAKKIAAEERQAEREQAQRQDAVETMSNLDQQWTEAEARGAEKYTDFAEKMEDFRTNAPCPPLVAAAIQHSPVGEDVAYHLANNQTEAKLIAAELMTGDDASVLSACRRFGEIEGQYLDKEPAMPGRGAGPLDMAHYAGMLKGYTERKARTTAETAPVKVTNAPEPAKHRVRGGAGQFTPDFSSDNADLDALAKKLV